MLYALMSHLETPDYGSHEVPGISHTNVKIYPGFKAPLTTPKGKALALDAGPVPLPSAAHHPKIPLPVALGFHANSNAAASADAIRLL